MPKDPILGWHILNSTIQFLFYGFSEQLNIISDKSLACKFSIYTDTELIIDQHGLGLSGSTYMRIFFQ